MGGTPPFSIPGGRDGWSIVFLFFLGRCTGRGEETRGGGGVAVRSGIGGVGIEGATGG